jgi:hypothetical protein
MSVEPPPPSPEQLADWQGLVERIRQGDRSEVVAWDEVAAARSAGTYQVLVTQRVHQRLRGAPPLVAGSVASIVASFGWIRSRPARCFADAAGVMVAGR